MKKDNDMLIDAAKSGKAEEIENIFLSGMTFEKETVSNALMIASEGKNIDAAKALIKNGADVHKVMREAICQGKNNVIMSLIEAGVGTKAAVIYAIHNKNYEALQKMQESGVLNSNDQMVIAAATANDDAVANIILFGANKKDENGNTPLMNSAVAGNFEDFALAVACGADLNLRNNKGETPLMAWVRNDKVSDDDAIKAIDLSVKSGADINAQDNKGETGIFKAAFYGYETRGMHMFEKHGADANISDHRGRTAVMEMAERFSTEALTTVTSGMSVEQINQTDNNGHTVLMHAVIARDPERVAMLISQGADVNAQTKDGLTAMMYAVRMKDNIEVVEKLIEAGANPNLQDKNGMTVLMLAARHGRMDIIKKLIESGADVTIKDEQGKTYLDYLRDPKAASENETRTANEGENSYARAVKEKLHRHEGNKVESSKNQTDKKVSTENIKTSVVTQRNTTPSYNR